MVVLVEDLVRYGVHLDFLKRRPARLVRQIIFGGYTLCVSVSTSPLVASLRAKSWVENTYGPRRCRDRGTSALDLVFH